MNSILARCIALSIAAASPQAQAFAQPQDDKTLDSLYERGQRELAPNWRSLGKTHESAVFVHQDVRKVEKGMLSVWTHHELPAAGYIDKEKAYLSTRDRVLVDCKAARTATADVAYYAERFGYGTVVATTRKNAEFAEAVPDSIEELLVKVVCAPKTARAAKAPKKPNPPVLEKQ